MTRFIRTELLWISTSFLLVVYALYATLVRFGGDTLALSPWVAAGGAVVLITLGVMRPTKKELGDIPTWFRWSLLLCTALFLITGTFLRIRTIQSHAFQNDEYYHVNTSVGLAKTGSFKRWNYVTQEVEGGYTRGAVYTVQVTASTWLFGTDAEWKYRLPSLVWGLGLLFLVPFLAWRWSRTWIIVTLLTGMVALDPGLIWSSVIVRMYSMLFFLTLCTIAAYVELVRVWKNNGDMRQQWMWGITMLSTLFFAVLTHQVALVLVPGFVLSSIWLWKLGTARNAQHWILGVLCVGGIAAVLIHLVTPVLPLGFFTVRQQPATQYFFYTVSGLFFPLLAASLLFAGIRKWNRHWLLIHVLLLLPALSYFVFFADRYSARKYSMLLVVSGYVLISWGARELLKHLSHPMQLVGLLLIAWSILPLPGLDAMPRYTRSYTDLEIHDYPTGYDTLAQAMSDNADPAYILLPRTYYLADRVSPERINALPIERQFTREDLFQLEELPHVFVAWPRWKEERHLRRDVRERIRKRWKRVESPGTGIIIYEWNR